MEAKKIAAEAVEIAEARDAGMSDEQLARDGETREHHIARCLREETTSALGRARVAHRADAYRRAMPSYSGQDIAECIAYGTIPSAIKEAVSAEFAAIETEVAALVAFERADA